MNKNNTAKERYQDTQVRFINQRLCDYYKEKKRYELGCYSGNYYSLSKQVCSEEANCWVTLSSLVKAGKALGFPLVYGTRDHEYGRTVYFEFFKDVKCQHLELEDASKNIILQTVIILYSLYKHGIFSDNFKFQKLCIPKTIISVSVNHMVLTLQTDCLVTLSINTHLYKAELSQSCYLDYITSFKNVVLQRNLVHTNYFFDWFIKNHFENISKYFLDVFKIKKNYVTTPKVSKLLEPGSLVYVQYNDALIIGISLSEVSLNGIVRVLYSPNGGSVFEIDDFCTNDVFTANELITKALLSDVNL